MDEHRTRRVSEAVSEELAEIIGFEMDDPRLADVSVTSADVSPDMRHAHVKVAIDTDAGAEGAGRPGTRQIVPEARTGRPTEPAAHSRSAFRRRFAPRRR